MPDELETLFDLEEEVTQVLSDLGVNEKLAEMDDFMNQNELKVNITNENATVTGLVTYTCTVKDKDNNALSNRVVEWYKGTTLLGLDATDSNGISTFSHRVTEADIYDVHAVVRGTHAGDDIRMFVKDKNNLLPFNQWSAGDIDSNFQPYVNVKFNTIRTNEWSSNGNYSIKLVTNETEGNIWRITYAYTENGTLITAKAKIFAPNIPLRIYLLGDSEGAHTYSSSVNVPVADEPQEIELSFNLEQLIDTVIISFQTFGTIPLNSYFYIDDVILLSQ